MLVLGYFAVTLFTSATLLFFVQPMIGKMILPRLGGTPAVWNTCMVFFQAVLLLGYGYTHFVSTRLPKRAQLILQSLLLLMPFTVLPFSLGAWTPPEDSNPVFSVLGILAIVVGVPFFVVSTSAPLLQKWFGYTGHPSAQDPYFLYGASNLGSMLALVLYPIALEPNFSLEPQTWIWTVGYGVFVVLVLGCIALVWTKPQPGIAPADMPTPQAAADVRRSVIAAEMLRKQRRAEEPAPIVESRIESVTWQRRARWIALAAVPSSLMLGCTTYLTTDIAAIPFFWVLPLALYLATFIFVFARWPVVWTESPTTSGTPGQIWRGMICLGVAGLCIVIGVMLHLTLPQYADPRDFGLPHILYGLAALLFFVFWVVSGTGGPRDFVLYFQPCILLFLVLLWVAPDIRRPTWVDLALHVMSFFAIAMMCHGELAADRPAANRLTEFYLCMSIGGVLGGLFNALAAPMLFRFGVLEYPLAMILSCFLRPNLATEATLIPGDSRKGQPTLLGYALDIGIPVGLGLLAGLAITLGKHYGFKNVFIAVPIVGALSLAMRPVRFGLALAIVWGIFASNEQRSYSYVFSDRGFFGLVKVRETADPETEFTYHTLIHGGIDHGRQHVEPHLRHEPCAYFHPLTGIGQVFMKLSWPNTPVPASVDEYNKIRTPYRTYSHPNPRWVPLIVGMGSEPFGALTAIHGEVIQGFSLPNARFPASLAAVGGNPLAGLVALHSEPPFAVLGLGTGTLAAFAKPYQCVDMYEIDPLVLRLSQRVDGKEPPFTYLVDAEARGANAKVILGDGRLKIEKAPQQWYHIICLDAFSSDAIPVHLLTVEAIKIYLDKLAPGGVLVFNATNKYVDITGVLKDAADELGLECVALSDWYTEMIPEKYGTDFVMLRRKPETIAKLGGTFSGGPALKDRLDVDRWASLMTDMARTYKDQTNRRMSWERWREPENHGGPLWTDSYSNLLGVLRIGR